MCNKFEMSQSVEAWIHQSVLPFKPVADIQIDQREEHVDNYALIEQVYPQSMSSYWRVTY